VRARVPLAVLVVVAHAHLDSESRARVITTSACMIVNAFLMIE
jgi:hypothetical protein